jgi:hypothetical protein
MDRIENSSRVFASFSAAHAKTRLDEVMLEVAREDATARGDDPDAAMVTPWRLHDLRRTAATTMPRLTHRPANHVRFGVIALSFLPPGGWRIEVRRVSPIIQ